jgi:hypothetical protein
MRTPSTKSTKRYEEAFMAMALREGALAGCGGVVRYLPEFRDV